MSSCRVNQDLTNLLLFLFAFKFIAVVVYFALHDKMSKDVGRLHKEHSEMSGVKKVNFDYQLFKMYGNYLNIEDFEGVKWTLSPFPLLIKLPPRVPTRSPTPPLYTHSLPY